MSAAFAVDLDMGIPISAKPSPQDERKARDSKYVGRDLFPYVDESDRRFTREQQWVDAFRKAGCDFLCSNGHFGYRMPDPVIDEGIALLGWLKWAEEHWPGISYRAHAAAFDFDNVSKALARMRAKGAAS